VFVVDTNILVYAADEDSPLHGPARTLVEAWREGPDAWHATWSIQYEFLRVVTHAGAMRHPRTASWAWRFLEALHESPGYRTLVPGERHGEIARATFHELPDLRGNAMHDAHIAILMREHGIRTIYTRDTGFRRFPFLDAVDPIAGVHERPRRRRRVAAT